VSRFGQLDFGVCQRGDPDRIPSCSTGELWWKQYFHRTMPLSSYHYFLLISSQHDTYQKDKRAKAGTVHKSSAVSHTGNSLLQCKCWDFHSRVVKEFVPLLCAAAVLGDWLSTFRNFGNFSSGTAASRARGTNFWSSLKLTCRRF
jgi:hypothetical protein